MQVGVGGEDVDWPKAQWFDDSGLGVLDDATCWQLLEAHRTGRLGLSIAALPAILPVAYAVTDRSILVEDPVPLPGVEQGHVACLQIDRFDVGAGSWWTVSAVGRLEGARLSEPTQGGPTVSGEGQRPRLRLSVGLLTGHLLDRA